MSIESRKRLLKNTVFLSIPSAINPFVSLALVFIVSRKLGVEGLGQYSLLSSYINIFTTFASLGLGALLVREIARRPDDIHVLTVNAIFFGLVSSSIAMVLMDFGVTLMGYEHELLVAFVIGSISLVPGSCSRFLESTFRAVEKSEFIAFGQLLENFSRVGLCFVVLFMGFGIIAISTVTVVAKILALGLLLLFYLKLLGFTRIQLRKRVWTMFLKESPTFMGIAFFSTVYGNIDVILLSKLASVSAVGIYGAAVRLQLMCVIIPLGFSLAILPTFSRHFGWGTESLREKAELSIRYVLIIAIPMAIGVTLLADKFIFLIYGDKFVKSVLVLQIMAPSLIPYSLTLILAQTLIAANYQKIDLHINMLLALVSSFLNYFLIQRFEELGAVVTSLTCSLLFLICQVIFIEKTLFRLKLLHSMKKPLIAGILMGLITFSLHETNLFLNVFVSVVVYFGLIFYLKALGEDEMTIIKGLIHKIGSLIGLR
jgi:O-antigen/teichoic acid export membrane protein